MSARRMGVEDLFEALERMIEDLQNDVEQSFKEFENFNNESKSLMYGFTMTIGPTGEPVIKTFGDKEIKTGFREPVYDQFVKTNTDELLVTMEMPGISKEEIELNATESKLVVTTEGERKYRCVVDLNVPVDPETAKALYRNGILSVTLRVKGKGNKGIKIGVE
ncbi:MAG: Hsp20/alpha crystallin family protein [Nitrososphaerales archaeon]